MVALTSVSGESRCVSWNLCDEFPLIFQWQSKRAAARPGGAWQYLRDLLKLGMFILLLVLFYASWMGWFPVLINVRYFHDLKWFKNWFSNNLWKRLQSVPRRVQEHVEVGEVGRVWMDDGQLSAHLKDREDDVIRNPQASIHEKVSKFEKGGVRVKEEYNLAIERQPLERSKNTENAAVIVGRVEMVEVIV